jgi:hypothetical protein
VIVKLRDFNRGRGPRPIYQVRRLAPFIWRWRVERDGVKLRTGFAFSKAQARWAARSVLRDLRWISEAGMREPPPGAPDVERISL